MKLLWIIIGFILLLGIIRLVRKGRRESYMKNLEGIKVDGVKYYHNNLHHEKEIGQRTGKTAILNYLDELNTDLP